MYFRCENQAETLIIVKNYWDKNGRRVLIHSFPYFDNQCHCLHDCSVYSGGGSILFIQQKSEYINIEAHLFDPIIFIMILCIHLVPSMGENH